MATVDQRSNNAPPRFKNAVTEGGYFTAENEVG